MMGVGAIEFDPVLKTGTRIPAASAFRVPKSPLRADGARQAGRDGRASLATDTVDIPYFNPTLIAGTTYPTPSPQAFRLPDALNPGKPENGDDANRGSVQSDARKRDGRTALGNAAENREEELSRDSDEADEKNAANGEPLDEQQQQEVAKLEKRDLEVRQHEQAHKAVGGSHAGAISYEYQQGPDGKRYAVGGEVSIDVSPEKDSAATVAKMRQVRAAALAPAQPSAQDLSVAAEASKQEAVAKQEASKERMEKSLGGNGEQTAESDSSGGDSSDAPTAESAGEPSSAINEQNRDDISPSRTVGATPYARLAALMERPDRRQTAANTERRSLSAFGIDVFA